MTTNIDNMRPADVLGWLNYQTTFETTTYKGFLDYWNRFTKLKPGFDITLEDYTKLRGTFRDSLETAARNGGINIHKTQELKNLVTYGLLNSKQYSDALNQKNDYLSKMARRIEIGGGVYEGKLKLNSSGGVTMEHALSSETFTSDTNFRLSFPLTAQQIRANMDSYRTQRQIATLEDRFQEQNKGQKDKDAEIASLKQEFASLRRMQEENKRQVREQAQESSPTAILEVKKGQKYVRLSPRDVTTAKELLVQSKLEGKFVSNDVLDVAALQEQLANQPAAQKYQNDHPNATWADGKFGKATLAALQEYINGNNISQNPTPKETGNV